MAYRVCTFVAFGLFTLLSLSSTLMAGTMISSFDQHRFGGSAFGCPSERFEFFLEHDSQEFTHIVTIGKGLRFWEDGEVGFFDITPENSEAFSEFAALVSDGHDDFIISLGYAEECGGGGGPGFMESEMLGGAPDLAGWQLESVRLVVHNMNVEAYDPPCDCGPATRFDADMTWEFWGTPVPEPRTIGFLSFVGMILLRRCRRARDGFAHRS
ncbi:MAG: hypothetical protein AMXMBFR20_30390 [Planctomycetia bacterium]